jgi:hypothetical protein
VFRTAKLFCSASYYCSSDYGNYVTDTLRPEAFFQTPPPPQEHQEKPKKKKPKQNTRGIYQKKLENVSNHLLQSAEQQQQSLPLASAAATCANKNREILANSPNPNFCCVVFSCLLLAASGTAATAWFPPHRTAFTQERMDGWIRSHWN